MVYRVLGFAAVVGLILAGMACAAETGSVVEIGPTVLAPTLAPTATPVVDTLDPMPTVAAVVPAAPVVVPTVVTVVPTVVPTAAAVSWSWPVEEDICYRTPEIQEWIISRLRLESCQLITERELFRITERMSWSSRALKPGDLRGLANVRSLSIRDTCGEWGDEELVSGLLDGFNPAADISVEFWVRVDDRGDPTPEYAERQVDLGFQSAESVVSQHFENLRWVWGAEDRSMVFYQVFAGYMDGGYGSMTGDESDAWRAWAEGIISELDMQAEAVGRAVAVARGNDVVKFEESSGGGVVVQSAVGDFGEVRVSVSLREVNDMDEECG